MGSSRVSRSFVQELLSQIDIVDIISHYLTLKQSGRNFVALCPFHPEKTPSFVVSPEKQIFKCFGCGVGGNAITFVQQYENLSFFEAVKRVAEIAGVELPREAFEEDSSAVQIEEAGLQAAKYFHSQLSRVENYLSQRGVSRETAEKFLVGYAPPGYLRDLKLKSEALVQLGLKSSKGKEFFRERLIIPIFNHSGKVVAFAGRALKEGQEPKYINSPESSLFKKNSTLYGFYQSKEFILKERKAVIVEGYFDVISLYQAGIYGAVAPMGTSLTENHVKFLRRYTSSPVLLFDGDSAGRKATIRSAGLFYSFGCEPLVVQLPDGEDPDSMARKSPEVLRELLSSPVPFLEWAVKTVKSLPSVEQPELLKQVALAVAGLKEVNPFLFKEYLSRLSAEFGIDEAWLRSQLPRFRKREEVSLQEEPIPVYEKAFLRALLDGLELPIDVSPNIFVSQKVSKLYSIISQTGERDATALQSLYPEVSPLISDVLFMEISEEELRRYVCRVLAKELERRMRRTSDISEKVELKKLIFELKKGNLEIVEQLQTIN